MFFSFPQPLAFVGNVVDLGMIAGPLAVAFLVASLDGLSRRQAIQWGFLASLAAHYLLFHWFYVVTVTYGHAPVGVGVLAPLLPSVFVSLFTALFSGCWQSLRRDGWISPFVVALLWTAIDHLRGFALGGFPWGSLGYVAHDNAMLLPWARFAGVHGLTFVVVLLGTGVAQIVRETRSGTGPSRSSLAALGVVMAAFIGGALLGRSVPPTTGSETIRVAALQGNIDQNEKWSPERVGANLGTYLHLSKRAIDAGAEVVVWPESAVPGFLDLEPDIRDPIRALARAHGTTFVLGAVGATLDPNTGELSQFYDSAYLMNEQGTLTDRYDKTHLVPFGEYLPFRWLFGAFVEAIARGIATVDVSAGEAPRAMSVARIGEQSDVRIGVPICYELLFPDLVRRMSRDGAQVLFAITNDAWYGRTGAPYQFLAMTAVRAAENGLYTVRAANSGVSALIDSRGKVVQQSEIYVQDVIVGDIPLSPTGRRSTFYSQYGDIFAWICWAGLLALVLQSINRRRVERKNETREAPQ